MKTPTPTPYLHTLEDAAFNVTRSFGRLVAGLSLRRCDIGAGRSMTYYDNQRSDQHQHRPVIVLVHGFNADKDHWLRMAAYLSHYRVIIPDLVAHGDSWYDPNHTYDIPFYVKHLKYFLERLGVTRFHLVGNSMGGWVSAHYAHRYADEVETLSLFNACGVISPRLSPFFVSLKNQKNPFLYHTLEELDELMRMAFAKTNPFPRLIKNTVFRHGKARMRRTQKLFADITNHDQTYFCPEQMIDGVLPDIQTPTLVLWGDRDGIMDISMADIFYQQLPNRELVIMNNVGHTPMIETPKESARLYAKFLQKQSGNVNGSGYSR